MGAFHTTAHQVVKWVTSISTPFRKENFIIQSDQNSYFSTFKCIAYDFYFPLIKHIGDGIFRMVFHGIIRCNERIEYVPLVPYNSISDWITINISVSIYAPLLHFTDIHSNVSSYMKHQKWHSIKNNNIPRNKNTKMIFYSRRCTFCWFNCYDVSSTNGREYMFRRKQAIFELVETVLIVIEAIMFHENLHSDAVQNDNKWKEITISSFTGFQMFFSICIYADAFEMLLRLS